MRRAPQHLPQLNGAHRHAGMGMQAWAKDRHIRKTMWTCAKGQLRRYARQPFLRLLTAGKENARGQEACAALLRRLDP